jgi:hypothetical protein
VAAAADGAGGAGAGTSLESRLTSTISTLILARWPIYFFIVRVCMLGSALLLSRRRMTSVGLPPLHTLLPPQVLFGVSIRDNIAYGRLWEPVSQQEIEEAAIAANAHDFIVGLAQASTLASSCFQLAPAPPRSFPLGPLGPESSD